MNNSFGYKGKTYYVGSIVRLYQNVSLNYKCITTLKFVEYDKQVQLYYFESLYNCWDRFAMTKEQVESDIEEIVVPYTVDNLKIQSPYVEPQCIDGIVSAVIWYILIMLFAMFLKGAWNVIGTQIVASIIFWRWFYKKRNGG